MFMTTYFIGLILKRGTLLIIPLSLHLLHKLQIRNGVSGLGRGSKTGQKISNDNLIVGLAGGSQAGQILKNQFLPIARKALQRLAGDVHVQRGQILCQRQMPELAFQVGAVLSNGHQAEHFGAFLEIVQSLLSFCVCYIHIILLNSKINHYLVLINVLVASCS